MVAPPPACCIVRLPLRASSAACRLDVGGKLLTSHLKELVSLRQWNVMGDTYMVNGIKERLCFVAQ